MYKLWRKTNKNEKGITGLETAIILIAFIIVASVFAYVVLSAGLFSAQKAKEAINAGIQSAMATLEIKGDMIAKIEDSELAEIYLCFGVPASGSPVDFTTSDNASENATHLIVVSYSDSGNYIPSVNWTVDRLSMVNDDYLLDPGELFQMTIILSSSDNVSVGPYDTFSLEIKPADGPSLTVERTLPGRVDQYVNLH